MKHMKHWQISKDGCFLEYVINVLYRCCSSKIRRRVVATNIQEVFRKSSGSPQEVFRKSWNPKLRPWTASRGCWSPMVDWSRPMLGGVQQRWWHANLRLKQQFQALLGHQDGHKNDQKRYSEQGNWMIWMQWRCETAAEGPVEGPKQQITGEIRETPMSGCCGSPNLSSRISFAPLTEGPYLEAFEDWVPCFDQHQDASRPFWNAPFRTEPPAQTMLNMLNMLNVVERVESEQSGQSGHCFNHSPVTMDFMVTARYQGLDASLRLAAWHNSRCHLDKDAEKKNIAAAIVSGISYSSGFAHHWHNSYTWLY